MCSFPGKKKKKARAKMTILPDKKRDFRAAKIEGRHSVVVGRNNKWCPAMNNMYLNFSQPPSPRATSLGFIIIAP